MWTRYLLFNLNDFDRMQTPDITLNVNLENIGVKSIRVIKTENFYSLIYDGLILTPFINDKNAFVYYQKGIGAYIDEKRDLYLGVYNEDNQ